MDSNNENYNLISRFITGVTSCAEFCGKVASPGLVGFSHTSTQSSLPTCACLFNKGSIPNPPSGLNWHEIDNILASGTGPIKGSINVGRNFSCYAFPQVSEPVH